MPNRMINNFSKLNTNGKRGIIREFAFIMIGAIFLFVSAGTFHWARGWIYISITLVYQVAYVATLLIVNPQLLNDRGNFNWKDTRLYDKYFIMFYPILSFSAIIIAGLDAVRYEWSSIPFVTVYPGILVFVLASYTALWAYIHNAHFLLTHRDDKVSGQQVCTTGPYEYIRHPAYLGAIITSLCFPFIVGSLFSLIPVLLNVVLLVIRTHYEDKTLKIELSGYNKYSRATKYRLLPFIW